MGEICIPLPRVEGGQKAEISVKVPGQENSYNYRIECFSFEQDNQTADIQYNEELFNSLKDKIEHYDGKWELLQVYAPEGNDNLIKVLYRQR